MIDVQTNIKFNTILGSFQFIQNILDKAIMQISTIQYDEHVIRAAYVTNLKPNDDIIHGLSILKNNTQLIIESYIDLKNIINTKLITFEQQYDLLLKNQEVNQDEISKFSSEIKEKFKSVDPDAVIKQINNSIKIILDDLNENHKSSQYFAKINAQYELILANIQYLLKINTILDTTIYTLSEVEKMLNE